MDADTLRIILVVFGALVLAGLYAWERRRHGSDEYDDDEADADEHDRERGKREPRLGPWDGREGDGADAALRPDASYGGVAGRTGSSGGAKRSSAESEQPESDDEPAMSKASRLGRSGGPMILTLHVASAHDPFDGAALVRAASRCGLEPGELDIYHCVLGEGVGRQVLFSMANMVKPGTFPFGAMADFRTPGVTLFTQLDGTPDDPGRLEEMLGTAHSLAADLGGEVKDQDRNPLTSEAEQGLRRRVMEFVGARLASAESK